MMDNLPPELFQLILNHLTQSARSALMRTSRRFYDIMLPCLYSDISLRELGYDRHDVLDFFIRTIVERPDIAELVHSLGLPSWSTYDEVFLDEPATQDIDFFKRLVREQPALTSSQKEWDRALEMGVMDPFLALILPRLVNLRHLSFACPFEPTFFLQMLNLGADGTIPLFEKLEDVYVTWYDTENGANCDDCLPFFHLPCVRRVHGRMLIDYEDTDEEDVGVVEGEEEEQEKRKREKEKKKEKKYRRNFSAVTDIDLEYSNSSDGLMSWIGACRELKSLRLEHGGPVVSFDDYSPQLFRRSLALQKTSLERLWITCIVDDIGSSEEGWIGSFADFSALRVLCLRLQTLVEREGDRLLGELWRLLPPSLEKLGLTGIFEAEMKWLLPQVECMLVNGHAPRLTWLGVEADGKTINDGKSFQELRRCCAQAGVELSFLEERENAEWAWRSIWPLTELGNNICTGRAYETPRFAHLR